MPKQEPKDLTTIKPKYVCFLQDIPIFLNYKNKVTCEEFDLTIKGNFLFIYDKNKQFNMIVPLTSVASAEVES